MNEKDRVVDVARNIWKEGRKRLRWQKKFEIDRPRIAKGSVTR